MTLKVIGSGEVVEEVFWFDPIRRTCGVILRDPVTGNERGEHLLLDELAIETAAGRTTRANVELAVGDRVQRILRNE